MVEGKEFFREVREVFGFEFAEGFEGLLLGAMPLGMDFAQDASARCRDGESVSEAARVLDDEVAVEEAADVAADGGLFHVEEFAEGTGREAGVPGDDGEDGELMWGDAGVLEGGREDRGDEPAEGPGL